MYSKLFQYKIPNRFERFYIKQRMCAQQQYVCVYAKYTLCVHTAVRPRNIPRNINRMTGCCWGALQQGCFNPVPRLLLEDLLSYPSLPGSLTPEYHVILGQRAKSGKPGCFYDKIGPGCFHVLGPVTSGSASVFLFLWLGAVHLALFKKKHD